MASRAIIDKGEDDREKGKGTDEGKMNGGLDQAEGGVGRRGTEGLWV